MRRRHSVVTALCAALGVALAAAPPAAAQRVIDVPAELAGNVPLESDTAEIGESEVSASAAAVAVTPAVAEMVERAFAASEGTPDGAAGMPLRQVTAGDVGALLRAERGHPTIFVLYYASCPRSHLALAYAAEVAERHRSTGVQVRAFAYGHTPARFSEYRDRLALLHEPLLVRPWAPGQLTAALQGAGVPLGANFGQPYVALLDGAGNAAGSWHVRTVRDFVVAAQGVDAALGRMR